MRKSHRFDAMQKGLPVYFTGIACVRGHVAERQTSNGTCVVCSRERHKKWLSVNLEKAKHLQQNWAQQNKAKHLATSRAWKATNPDKTTTSNAKRRAARIQRTPKWLTDEDRWWIGEVYHLSALRSKMTGVDWHVDHILPLQGKFVSGLHVPTNLRVVTATENEAKGNRYVG